MTQQDIMLAIADGTDGPHSLDPVRMMKGGFLAWKQGDEAWDHLFRFAPYEWGPFDKTIYDACARLENDGHLLIDRSGRHDRYEITESGRARVSDLEASEERIIEWLRSIGRYVTALSFDRLLRDIYRAYPEYAVASRFTV